MKFLTVFRDNRVVIETDEPDALVLNRWHIFPGDYLRMYYNVSHMTRWYLRRPNNLNEYVESEALPKDLKLLLLLTS